MKITNIKAVYFSPEGNTQKIVVHMAKKLSEALGVPFTLFDATRPKQREVLQEFGRTELAVIGVPTYAGRVPNKLLPYIQSSLTGGGAPAIPVVTFGNRSFDNSLKELCGELEQHGFHTVAAAAVAARHAFSDKIADGRPDEADWKKVDAFVKKTAENIREMREAPMPVEVSGMWPAEYYTPLGSDGKTVVFLKAKPKTTAACTHCGICAAMCPMGAIDKSDETLVPGVCIKCQACVRKCPMRAKYFEDAAFLSHVEMLENNYTTRVEPEFFYS